MATEPEGPGWWQASDGRWYPPELHPDATAYAPPIEQPPIEAPPTFVAPPPFPGTPTPPPSGPTWTAPAAPPPRPKPRRTGLIAALAVVVVALVAVAVVALGSKDDGSSRATKGSSTADSSAGSASDPTASSDASPASTPDGWTVLEGDGVSLAVPPGWRQIDPGDLASNSSALSDLQSANSDASDLLGMGAAVLAHGAKLAAASPAESSFLAVIKLPIGLDPTSSAAQDELRSGLESAGGTGIDMSVVTLPAGEALRLTATIDLTLPNGSKITEHEVGYVIRVGKATYELTMGVVGPGSTDDFDTIAGTFATS